MITDGYIVQIVNEDGSLYLHFDACGDGPVLAVDFGQSGEAGGSPEPFGDATPGDLLLREPWPPSSPQTAIYMQRSLSLRDSKSMHLYTYKICEC